MYSKQTNKQTNYVINPIIKVLIIIALVAGRWRNGLELYSSKGPNFPITDYLTTIGYNLERV